MDNLIITGLLVVYFFWLLMLHSRNKNRRNEIYALQDDQATAAQAILNTVQNNISSAIKEATESTKAGLINTHKALITKTAEAHQKEMMNQTVKLTGKVNAFEQHTKEYFKVNLDNHLTKAESRLDALEKKKDELETCINSELSDLREFERKIITALNQTGIVFNKVPNGDTTFDFYVCEKIGTSHMVPKKFDHWKAQLEPVYIDPFIAIVYINEDSNDEIKIPIPLLKQIQTPEPREPRQERKETSIQISDQETTNLLICPVCGDEFTSLKHTRQHINERKDEQHEIFRVSNPGYADKLTAAMEKERYAPRLLDNVSNKDPLSTGEAGANIKGTN